MGLHRIKKGLRLPIQGEPEQTIDESKSVRRVALLGADYVGMRPTMHVSAGDDVRRGQLVFEDKKMPGVRHTAPGAGKDEKGSTRFDHGLSLGGVELIEKGPHYSTVTLLARLRG